MHELALTLPHWRECLRPIAASWRRPFARRSRMAALRIAWDRRARAVVTLEARTGQVIAARNASQPRPYTTRKWRTPTVEARPSSPIACAMCGEPVLKRRRRHCEACMPKARREHGLHAIEPARKALAAQSAAGNDPRRDATMNRGRGEAISEGHASSRTLNGRIAGIESPARRTLGLFQRKLQI
jgi:hypothetical protein